MAYDFPASPTEGQEFVPPMGGHTYVWRSPRWLVKGIPPLVDGGVVGTGIEEAPVNTNQYARSNAAWVQITASYDWSTLPGKPATFPPDSHIHAQSEVTGLTAALNAKEPTIPGGTPTQFWRGDKTWQTPPVPDWSSITSKPGTFPPATHSHPQNEVTNLVADLSTKAPVVHTHPQADVVGLVNALSGKEAVITGGTTTQFWRGDKTWQAVPAGDWSGITGKPATFPPSGHAHPMTDITGLDIAFNGKSDVGHVHSYSTLTGIPNTFIPSPHIHAQSEITNLVANLAEKASLTSPTFIGTVTLPITNVVGALTGVTASFSSTVRAVASYYVKPTSAAAQNIHFWFQGYANEDRVVLYTPAAALGSFIVRVGGAQSYTFDSAGGFHAPTSLNTVAINASGAIAAGGAISGTTITSSAGISTTNGHITANDYVYSQAGYFIGAAAHAILGTSSGSVGDVYLRPSGYNSSANQTYVDGATGNLYAATYILSNGGRFYGHATSVVLSPVGPTGTVYLRPNGGGTGTGQMTVNTDGIVETYNNIICNGNVYLEQDLISLSRSVVIGGTGTDGAVHLRPNSSTSAEQAYYQYNGNFTIGNQGYKAVAGSWAASSDARIKTVVGDYTAGLKEILQLRVRRYLYKGNETLLAPPGSEGDIPAPYEDSPHYRMALEGEEHISLIAQEAEKVMPDLVTLSEAWIDGIRVFDFRTLNPTNITWALINAVQEMAARIQTLEGEVREYTTGTGRTKYPRLAG